MSIPTDSEMCAVDGSDMDGRWASGLGGHSDLNQDSESQEREDYTEDESGFPEGSDEDMEDEWGSSEESDDNMEADDQMEIESRVDEGNDNSMSDIPEFEEGAFPKERFSPVLAQIRFDELPEFIVLVRQYYDKVDRGVWSGENTDEESDGEESSHESTSSSVQANSDEEPDNSDEGRDHGQDEKSEESTSDTLGREGAGENGGSGSNARKRNEMNSVIVGPPIFGDLHVVYPLEFPDGIKWALKIPANGTPKLFDEASRRALRSEALTVDLLRRNTTIPLPRVFGFEEDCKNELECPFIIMEFTQGKPLSEFWYHDTSSAAELRAYRARILKDISEAMVQLDQFSFDEGGFPKFNSYGELEGGVGPLRLVKHRASVDDELGIELKKPSFVKSGPFDDPDLFFKAMIKQHRKPSSSLGKGALKLFRMFLSEIPDLQDRSSFVLSHPNLDLEHIIVSKHGKIRSFIGWTDVCSVPRVIGNESYPWWLLDDYLSTPNEDPNTDIEFDGSLALSDYRGMYDRYMIPTFSKKRAFSLTQTSHVALSLYAAALNPEDTITILSNLFDEMVKISRPPPENPGFEDLCYALHGGYLTERQREYLDTAIEQLLEPVRCNLYRTHSLKKWIDRDWPEPQKYPFPYLN